MRKLIFLVGVLLSSTSHAQRVEPMVTWHFNVRVGSGVPADYNTNLGRPADIALPADSAWRCTRGAVLAPLNGIASGAFNCSNGAGHEAVWLEAKCEQPTQPRDATHVVLSDAHRLIYLSASCSM